MDEIWKIFCNIRTSNESREKSKRSKTDWYQIDNISILLQISQLKRIMWRILHVTTSKDACQQNWNGRRRRRKSRFFCYRTLSNSLQSLFAIHALDWATAISQSSRENRDFPSRGAGTIRSVLRPRARTLQKGPGKDGQRIRSGQTRRRMRKCPVWGQRTSNPEEKWKDIRFRAEDQDWDQKETGYKGNLNGRLMKTSVISITFIAFV